LIWSDRRAGLSALVVLGWLLSVELGTSRTASRAAANEANASEQVVDTSTSRLFDAAAAVAISGGVVASLTSPSTSIRPQRASFAAGLVVLCGSGGLSWFARRHLGRFHRDALTVHADHELIDTGPYGLIRHPLYSATIGAFAGVGAVLGNWVSLGLALVPTLALLRRIKVEEDMLLDALGAEYDEYRNRSKRLMPWVW
jgi:protein-S-isoprenylcysteine O-methyltransferase Ste14